MTLVEMALFIIDTCFNEHCELSTRYDLKLRVVFRYPPQVAKILWGSLQ